MALTPDQYISNAESALANAVSKANSAPSTQQAQAAQALADAASGYVALLEATRPTA